MVTTPAESRAQQARTGALAQLLNPEAWAAMRNYFPTATAAFERLVKEALHG